MSGELWRMAQAGITLFPDEVKMLATDYFLLYSEVLDLRAKYAHLLASLTPPENEPDSSHRE